MAGSRGEEVLGQRVDEYVPNCAVNEYVVYCDCRKGGESKETETKTGAEAPVRRTIQIPSPVLAGNKASNNITGCRIDAQM